MGEHILAGLGIKTEARQKCEHTLLILPAMPCAASNSFSLLLVNSSPFLAHPINLRVRALSEGLGCGHWISILVVEAEATVLEDAIEGSNWAMTCSADGQGISSSLLHSSSEQPSLGCSAGGRGSFCLSSEAATICLKWAQCTCNLSVTFS